MEIFKEHISEKTFEELKRLINAEFFRVYSPEISINTTTNQYSFWQGFSWSYEIDNKRAFIVVLNNCIETVDRTLGYKLEVLLEDKPLGIVYKYNGVSNPPVSLYPGRQKLKKIEIYNYHKIDKDKNEEINYDALISFYFNDGSVFVVSTPNDYSQTVILKICSVEQLCKEVKGLNLRVVVE